MHPVFTPGTGAAIVKAAEEAGAVFSIQTFVSIVILLMIGNNVVHLQQ